MYWKHFQQEGYLGWLEVMGPPKELFVLKLLPYLTAARLECECVKVVKPGH